MDVLSVAEMARADEATIAGGTSGFELMRRAGQAVARSAAEMSLRGPILIVVGRGNNGVTVLLPQPSWPRRAAMCR